MPRWKFASPPASERRYRSRTEAIRAWGPVVGGRYLERIDILRGAPALAELYQVPSLRFHRLTGDRAGQYAVNLTGQTRLILTLQDDGALQVEEVVDYHGWRDAERDPRFLPTQR